MEKVFLVLASLVLVDSASIGSFYHCDQRFVQQLNWNLSKALATGDCTLEQYLQKQDRKYANVETATNGTLKPYLLLIRDASFTQFPSELLNQAHNIFVRVTTPPVRREDDNYFMLMESGLLGFYYHHDSNLKRLTDESFKKLRKCFVIDLSYNAIDYVSGDIFPARELRMLNLAHNRIYHINYNVLASLKYLQKLDLSYNRLDTIPYGLFSFQSALERLDLSFNNLFFISHDFTLTLVNLKQLFIHNAGRNALSSNELKTFLKEVSPISHSPSINLGISNSMSCDNLVKLIQDFGRDILSSEGADVVQHQANLFGIGCYE